MDFINTNNSIGRKLVNDNGDKCETSLLEDVVIDKHYSCQKPIETIIYDENMELYQVGELMTIWELPQIRRDVRQYLE